MNGALNIKPQPALLASLLHNLTKLGRDELGQVAEKAIDRMDSLAPDPDLEGQWDEDGINSMYIGYQQGPGCMISDPDHGVDDLPCDPEAEDGT